MGASSHTVFWKDVRGLADATPLLRRPRTLAVRPDATDRSFTQCFRDVIDRVTRSLGGPERAFLECLLMNTSPLVVTTNAIATRPRKARSGPPRDRVTRS